MTQTKLQEIDLIVESLGLALGASDLEDVLSKILDKLLSIPWLNLESRGCIFLVDEKTQTLQLAVERGLHPKLLELCGRGVPYGHCLCGRVAESKQTVFASCLDERHDVTFKGIKEHGHYCLTIMHGDVLYGVFTLYLPHGHKRNEYEERYLKSFADIIALTIEKIDREKMLKENERKFRMIAQSTHDAVISVSDKDATITFWNDGARVIFGHKAEEILGKGFTTLLPKRYWGGYTEISEHARSIHNDFKAIDTKGTLQLKGLRKDGDEFPLELTLASWVQNDEKIWSAIIRDVTERKRVEKELWTQAHYDELTGLPNRKMVDDRLSQAKHFSKREDKKVAVMFIDLDRFKHVNDTLGHDAGDILLQEAARRLQDCVREADTVIRLGGDEFLIILDNIKKKKNVEAIGKKILEKLNSVFIIKEKECFISGSIGVALFPNDGHTAEELMKKADIAMYQSKEAGRSTLRFYTDEISRKTARRSEIEQELRKAIKRQEFSLVFQPIVKMAGQQLTGFEALLRWNSKKLGVVSPAEFIPIAEESNLMNDIGLWVLNNACAAAKKLNRPYIKKEEHSHCPLPYKMSINASVKQLDHKHFIKTIVEAVQSAKITPDCIQLEITETLLMKNIEDFLKILDDLDNIGVDVVIDDFGTGYSSLTYLKRLNASTVKVDRAFVNGLPDDKDDKTIVNLVTSMSHALDLEVTAEGVEKEEQLRCLEEIGCDKLQGHLLGKPLSLKNALAAVKKDQKDRKASV